MNKAEENERLHEIHSLVAMSLGFLTQSQAGRSMGERMYFHLRRTRVLERLEELGISIDRTGKQEVISGIPRAYINEKGVADVLAELEDWKQKYEALRAGIVTSSGNSEADRMLKEGLELISERDLLKARVAKLEWALKQATDVSDLRMWHQDATDMFNDETIEEWDGDDWDLHVHGLLLRFGELLKAREAANGR